MLTASGWDSLAASNAHIELYRACSQARFDNSLEVLAEIGVVGIRAFGRRSEPGPPRPPVASSISGTSARNTSGVVGAPSTRHRLFRSQSRIAERRSLVLVAVSIS